MIANFKLGIVLTSGNSGKVSFVHSAPGLIALAHFEVGALGAGVACFDDGSLDAAPPFFRR